MGYKRNNRMSRKCGGINETLKTNDGGTIEISFFDFSCDWPMFLVSFISGQGLSFVNKQESKKKNRAGFLGEKEKPLVTS